ncbi:MAG: flagellar hook-basal body complex protein [Synergistaceae bacterium]|jgi:flagellar hook protein FlgE|nr:flagellar hook-basal body complex protein [Synergistaceae bacterium]
MLRSLYSAVSGIKAHQTYLDVTGNNIANVNTVGFKRDVVHFRDMIYQSVKNSSQPDASIPIGGVNPAQVGLGVSVGSIETVHTQGSLQNTGIPTDMAISGSGYFVVRSAGQTLYTRAGNFSLDRDGNLVMQGNGYLVQGYAYKDVIDPATGNTVRQRDPNLTNINIPIGEKIPAKATTLAAFRCNLCTTDSADITDLTSIPGGSAKVPRPHDYTAYAGESVTYVGNAANEGAISATLPTGVTAAEGNTYFSTATKEIYIYDQGSWVHSKNAEAETYYYGSDTDANAAFPRMYTDGTTSGTVVTARVIIDRAMDISYDATTGLPDNLPNPQTDTTLFAGAKILDTTDPGGGRIFELNSTRTAWTEIDPMKAETAYGVRADGKIYVLNNATPPVPTEVTNPMDITTGNKNIFVFENGAWKSINDTKGGANSLSPSGESKTTQEIMEAFGESIMKAHDHEDKFTVYDSLGSPHTMVITFRKVMDRPADTAANVGAESEWDWYTYYTDSDGNVQPQYGQGGGTLVFGDDGLLKRTYTYTPTPLKPNPNATNTPTAAHYDEWTVVEKIIDKNDPNYNSAIHDSLPTGLAVADFNVSGAQGKVNNNVSPSVYGSNLMTIDFLGSDYAKTLGLTSDPIDGVTSYGSDTTTKLRAQDGYAMGVLNDWTVGSDGVIQGSYSNGKILAIAQVALAMFDNPQGLSQVGETCFAATINSGLAQVGAPQANGAGSIQGNTVEMSNVDLSEEFVNLIRAQRGFQASTRVVTTSDDVLQELINLKR